MPKRVVVFGFFIECNAFAPSVGAQHFENGIVLEGDGLAKELEAGGSIPFGERLSELEDVEYIPLFFYVPEAAGPVEETFFSEVSSRLKRELDTAGEIDGVFAFLHGAARTSTVLSVDTEIARVVRASIGETTPFVVVSDYHGNISEELVRLTSVLIGFRTDPHVDVGERMREAADHMSRLMHGATYYSAILKPPLAPPSIVCSTKDGEVFGDIVAEAEAILSEDIVSVSVFAGFLHGDSPHGGVSILASSVSSMRNAEKAVETIGWSLWKQRHRLRRDLVSLDDVGRIVLNPNTSSSPIILADVGDNPGAGAAGNTVWLLDALIKLNCGDVLIGMFHDPSLAVEAFNLGVGATFEASFNRDAKTLFSERTAHLATVVHTTDQPILNTRGVQSGSKFQIGRSAALAIGDVTVVITEFPIQIYSDDFFSHFQLQATEADVIVVKSRGHFRAGFEHLVSDGNIYEIDAPGLCSPNFSNFSWKRLRQDAFPQNEYAEWGGR